MTTQVNNQITLGNVTVAGKAKIAVLSFFDDKGNVVPVTDEMLKAHEAYRSIVQKIIDGHQEYYNKETHGEIEAITSAGITYTKETPPEASHTVAKTKELWDSLIYYGRSPAEIGAWRAKVDFIDIDKFEAMPLQQRFDILKQVHDKRHKEVFDKKTVQYNKDEELVLRIFRSTADRQKPLSDQEEVTALLAMSVKLEEKITSAKPTM